MPQVSYLVRTQTVTRLSDPSTGFNHWLAQACASQTPVPTAYVIDWTDSSSNFWQSYVASEDLDATSAVTDGTLCLVYGLGLANQTDSPVKFAMFSGMVELGVAFEIAWLSADAPKNTDGLADATDDAMIATFNSPAYYGAFGSGVLYNGLVRDNRGPLRQSGEGWRQRIPYTISFDVQV